MTKKNKTPRFPESIIALRKWQLHLPNDNVDSRYAKWMRKSFHDVLSIIPIYMDRIKVFASPLYGFDTLSLWNRNSISQQQGGNTTTSINRNRYMGLEINEAVNDFLRRQEKIGGPPTAVALVFKGEGDSSSFVRNNQVERGYYFMTDTEQQEKTQEFASTTSDHLVNINDADCSENEHHHQTENRNALNTWPALYLRSTMHTLPGRLNKSPILTSSSSSHLRGSSGSILPLWPSNQNMVENSPRFGGRSFGDNSPRYSYQRTRPFGSETTNHHTRGSGDISLTGGQQHQQPPSHRSKISSSSNIPNMMPVIEMNQAILEYAPDTGNVISWPHNDWQKLATLLGQSYEKNQQIQREHLDRAGIPLQPTTDNFDSISITKNRWFMNRSKKHEALSTPIDMLSPSSLLNSESHSDGKVLVENDNPLSGPAYQTMTGLTSTFHYASIGRHHSFVVMIKNDDIETQDEQKVTTNWMATSIKNVNPSSNNQKCLDNVAIRLFVEDMVRKLSISMLMFAPTTLQSIPEGSYSNKHNHDHHTIAIPDVLPQQQHTSCDDTESYLKLPWIDNVYDENSLGTELLWSDEEAIMTFLNNIKHSFHLQDHRHNSIDSTRSIYSSRTMSANSPSTTPTFGRRPRSLNHNRSSSSSSSKHNNVSAMLDHGVSLFFLGPELASRI